MINKIKCKLQRVDYILHIADIHLRNWKRHKEFREVFDRLFKVVDELPDNSIVTVGGDIVHAKTDMSPELIEMVSYLFSGLAERRPTVVIAGNHDANLNNPHRLDALSPIVKGINHPNLFYLRNSGLHEIGDIAISVMSLLDEPEKYVTYDKITNPDKYKRLVALYHGTLANSKVDSGLTLSHGLDWDTFIGFDVVPLGDIHKRQILSKQNPAIFYPGSLVQQNFGEAFEGHGYALIDLTKADIEYTFHDVTNDYGYYTLEVDNGILPDNLPITPRTNLRVRTINTDPAQLKRVLATIRREYRIRDVIVQKLDRSADGSIASLSDGILNQGDVRNVTYQNQLLTEYLVAGLVDDDTIAKVLEINKKLNQEINLPEMARNVVWKPKKFEFSNMFSYGEDNVLDFGTKRGTCGLFAPNHSGKSAVLDALCFCLFDQTSRTSKADQVLNRKKDGFSCKFNFEQSGVDYFVEKRAHKYKSGPLKGRLRVDIDFWMVTPEGERISLNGEQRRDTSNNIRSYVGTFDDFVLTALSLQQNSSNFIDKTQGERKDLLANFLDVTIFDSLCDLASKNNRKTVILLEEYQKQDFETKLGDAERSKELNEKKHESAELELEKAQEMMQELNEKLLELNRELQPCQGEGLDIDKLTTSLQYWSDGIKKTKQDKAGKDRELNRMHSEFAECTEKVERLKGQFNLELYKQFQANTQTKIKLDTQLSTTKLTIKNKLEKLDKLKDHEYNPDCQYCVSNIFVQDAMKTREELEKDKQTVGEFLSERQKIVDFIEQNSFIEDDAKVLGTMVKLLNKITLERGQEETAYERLKTQIEQSKSEIQKINTDIGIYNKNTTILKNNKGINDEIGVINKKKSIQSIALSKSNNTVKDYHARVEVTKQTISDCQKNIEHMHQLYDQQVAYELYTKAMYKDGIPYTLISKAVPHIQKQTNDILNQIVDFTVELETDSKNINAFICYDDDKWPLELCSGMEKFLSSIAIRIALIKITNLPKPDFIAIDEGLGVLDSTNLNSMHTLFTHMKDIFRFSLVISHLDVVRDMVDTILSIDKKDEMSYISC